LLSGGGDPNRYAKGIKENSVYTDGLYISCIAIEDMAGNRALIISQDTVNSSSFSLARTAIHEAYGTTQSTMPIMVTATHTHASFNFVNGRDATGDRLREKYYLPALMEAVEGALADLSPATMEMGEAQAVTADGKPLTAVRRYLVEKADGTTCYGSTSQGTPIKKLYEEFDLLQVLHFKRTSKPDVVMSTLGVHATMTGATSQLYASADWPGAVRYYLEANDTAVLGKDCYYVPFVSGAGDQVGQSELTDLRHGMDYVAYGEAVSDLILAQLKTGAMRDLGGGDLRYGKSNHSYESGRLVIDFGKNTADNAAITVLIQSYVEDIRAYFGNAEYTFTQKDQYAIDRGVALAQEIKLVYGVDLPAQLQFQGYYHANGIGSRLEKTADTEDVGLNALRIGDLALTFHSYELFGTSAQWLLTGTSNATDPATGTLTGETRTASPFGANTFVVSHANGAKGYIPHAEAYDYNCYESYVSNVGSTAEKAIHDHMIAILQSLKN